MRLHARRLHCKSLLILNTFLLSVLLIYLLCLVLVLVHYRRFYSALRVLSVRFGFAKARLANVCRALVALFLLDILLEQVWLPLGTRKEVPDGLHELSIGQFQDLILDDKDIDCRSLSLDVGEIAEVSPPQHRFHIEDLETFKESVFLDILAPAYPR